MEESKEYFNPNTERTLPETFQLVASHQSDMKSSYICVDTGSADG